MATITLTTDVTTMTAADFAMLSVSQLKALTASQWGQVVSSQLATLPAIKVAALALEFISPQALAGIATTVVADDSLAAINGLVIQKLSNAQIGALTNTQISALTAKKFANFSPEQLNLLSSNQLASAKISELSAEQLDAFSSTQLSALIASDFSSLSADALSGLTTKNLAGLSAAKINELNLDKLAALTPSQMNALTFGLNELTEDALARLSPDTLKALNANLPANTEFFTVKQIAALSPEKLASFSTAQLQAITASQAAALRPSQLAALSSEKATALSSLAIAAIRPQIVKYIDLSLFDSSDVGALTARQVAYLTTANVGQLTSLNAGGLTVAQINSMKQASLLHLTSAAKNALSTAAREAYDNKIVDETPPQAPAFNFGGQDNFVNSPLTSTQTTVTISGLEPNATWKYSLNGGSNFVTGAGTSFTLPPDIYAPHRIQVIQIDTAGNESLEAFNAAQIKAQVAVSAAGSFDAVNKHAGFQITMGDYVYNISNFSFGDSIHFPTGNTQPTITNSDFNDGIVEIEYVSNPNVVTIQISGLTPEDDAQIYSLATFKTLFGANSITTGTIPNNFSPTFNNSLATTPAVFNIGRSPVLLAESVEIYDAELSTFNNFAGASLTIQQTTLNAQDVFSVVNGIHTSFFQTSGVWFWQGNGEIDTDGSVHVGESNVGSYTLSEGSLTILFNWNATQAAVNQVLSSITYSNATVQTAGTINVTWQFNDGSGASASGVTQVDISPSIINQTITGGSGNDSLVGGAGNDYITDSQGDNTLDGGAGDDKIATNIAYSNGNTWVNGGSGRNTILGGDGNDTIHTASGNDSISGGLGDDLITTTTSEGGSGNDIISGGDGNDTIQNAFGNDSISGDAGDDRITDAGGSNTISGGLGNDTIIVNGYSENQINVLSGNDGNDRLEGGVGQNSINGGADNDTIYGNTGTDTLIGGTGSDQYYFRYTYDSNLDHIDQLIGEFDDANADLIHLPQITGTLVLRSTAQNVVALTETALNALLNSTDHSTTGFVSGSTAIAVITYNSQTLLVVDVFGKGYVDSDTMIIDVSNSTITSLTTATFISITRNGTTDAELITGSIFDDVISGDDGNDTLYGEAGNDTISGNNGDDSLLGGIGDDELSGNSGNDYISGGDGNDNIDDHQGNNTLLGGNGDDYISSSSGNNNISGGTGNDTIDAYDGFNTIDAGDGNDYIRLSWWSTTAISSVSAGNGNDTIDGSYGSDTILGDAGDDEIYDYGGNDSIDGGDGNDKISAGAGDDSIFGNTGDDFIADYEGHNLLSGGLGNDNIVAGIGNDSLLGGEGNDSLDAGSGNDTLSGGIGSNLLTGGEGNDSFIFAASIVAPSTINFDIINDFDLGSDVIDFTNTITIAAAPATAVVGTAQISSNGVANFAAADDTLAERLVAVEQAIQLNSLTAGEAAIFVLDDDSYIFISNATAGVGIGDVLIKLHDIVATSLTLNAGNIVAVTSPYSIADFSNSVSSIAAKDTVHILDTVSNISTSFDSLIITNLAKIDRIDVLNSTTLPLSITQFMTTGVVNVLHENSVSINATGATLSNITFFYAHLGKIAQNGLSNLALSTADQLEYEIYNLLSKATNATVVAASPTDYEINSFAKFAANIAIDGITGSYTLNDWNVSTTAEIASLLSKTSAAATVAVDASYMNSTKLITISAGISKVDSITNLSFNTSDFTDAQTSDLLKIATSNVAVNATEATTTEVASLILDMTKISTGSISGEISLTTAQALTLGSKLSPYIAITLTDTSATAANLLAIDALTTGELNANTITTVTGTLVSINSLLFSQSYSTINLNGLTNLILTETSNASLSTADSNVSSGHSLTINGSTTVSSFNFNGSAETDGRFSVVGGAGADSLVGGSGADTLSGGANNDSIHGNAGADIIIGGLGIDSLTGGDGADIFVFDSVDLDTNAGQVTDVITDFTTGIDKISAFAAGGSTTFSANTTAADSLSTLLTAADTALDGTVKYYFGTLNGDGYLVIDMNGTGYTEVIQLVGVTAIVATDIVTIA